MTLNLKDPKALALAASNGPPLDFSFKKLKVLSDLMHEKPRAHRVGSIPAQTSTFKFITKSVWLNNNNLKNMNSISDVLDVKLEQPELLGWIDFSYNKISEIDDEILKYTNLTIIYLHGNNINDFAQVAKLRNLPKLKTLTLHGNPIERQMNYRLFVTHILPRLVNLDHSSISFQDRKGAPPPGINKYITEESSDEEE